MFGLVLNAVTEFSAKLANLLLFGVGRVFLDALVKEPLGHEHGPDRVQSLRHLFVSFQLLLDVSAG